MRLNSVVTAVSWIPSESVTGIAFRTPFEVGFSHYDKPLPHEVDDFAALLRADKARFVNQLAAWIEVEDGAVVDHGHAGAGSIGTTTLSLGRRGMTFAAVALPDRRRSERVAPDAVRFEQTAGGRTGVPMPRRVRRAPYVQIAAPLAWSTLSLTLFADGREEFDLVGASPFPRHWVYDKGGRVARKSAAIDFRHWSNDAFGTHTPWGDTDSPTLTVAVETALERELSHQIMRAGARPTIRRLAKGSQLTAQGEEADELFLLLDGVLDVAVDGETLAEIGPGAVLGERALLETGRRTSTLTAVTPCTVAVAERDALDPAALERLSEGHRREDHRR